MIYSLDLCIRNHSLEIIFIIYFRSIVIFVEFLNYNTIQFNKMRSKITLQCIIATRKSFLFLNNAFITFLKY